MNQSNDRRGHNAAKKPGEVGFQPIRNPEASRGVAAEERLDVLEREFDLAEKRLRRAQVAVLAEQVHSAYPEVAYLEYEWRENPDTIVPPIAAAFDADEQELPQMVVDDLNRNFRSGLPVGFGDHVEGQVIDLAEAREPGYIDGVGNPYTARPRTEALGWPSLGDLMDDATARGLISHEDIDRLDDDDLHELGNRYVGSTIVSLVNGYSNYDSTSARLDNDELDRFRDRCSKVTGSEALYGIWESLEGTNVPSGTLDRMTDDQIQMFHSAHVRGPAAKMAVEIKSLLDG